MYNDVLYIVVDTNFILSRLKYKIDVLDEINKIVVGRYKFVIPYLVFNELEGLSKNKGKYGVYAQTSLEWLREQIRKDKRMKNRKLRKIIEVKAKVKSEISEINLDSWIIKYSTESLKKGKKIAVATNDKELRKSLKKRCVKTFTIKGYKNIVYS